MKRVLHHSRRVAIGIVGAIVVLIGIVMIPYPGPGWLVVFAGLAILATEFECAERLLAKVRHRYDLCVAWYARQRWWVRGLALLFTSLIVIVTVWLVNGFGILNAVLHLNQEWLNSPLI
jgi:uncharacterized protein (TIGR02611 family)